MSEALVFDTLAYAKKLKQAGVPEQQAEIQAEALATLVDEKLATKRDLKDLEIALKTDIKELEMRLTIRLGVMMAGAITIMAVLMKIL